MNFGQNCRVFSFVVNYAVNFEPCIFAIRGKKGAEM